MQSVRIRKGLSTDLQKVSEIHIRAWKSAYKGILPDEMLDQLNMGRRIQGWQMILEKEQGQLFVLEVGEELVGFTHIEAARDKGLDVKNVGEMTSIYLEPESVGRGFGKALLEYSLDKLRQSHFTQMSLWVLKDNKLAKDFYERNGFVFDGTQFVDPDRGFVSHRYIRHL